MIICSNKIQKNIVSSKLNYVERLTIYKKILSKMKYLLYYNLDSKFKSDQASVSGDGTSVVSVVDGVAWTEDAENVYYRYRNPDSENLTSYTITIHYKDINGNVIAPDDVITVDGYSGKGVSETIIAKSISGYTVISDDAKTFIIDGNIEYTFIYNDAPREETPLVFYILSSGTITWVTYNSSHTKTIQYSKNDGEWADITSNTGSSAPSISVVAGDVVKFRGNNHSYCDLGSGVIGSDINCFSSSTSDLRFNAYGNIMSLINSTNFKNLKTFTSTHPFTGLFSGCTSLVEADKLLLPVTTLIYQCYEYMFNGCTSLTTAPELPATTLADSCYYRMFAGCTSLTTAPELPGTTLAGNCYRGMFAGCTSLTTAPELPATTLADSCYDSMFQGCTSLTQAPTLPVTELASWCYCSMFQGCISLTQVPELPATVLTENCYRWMFLGCTSLTTAPELPATTLAQYCYCMMFARCTSLTKAPELSATTLADSCYEGMFNGCTSLTKAPELPATTLTHNCYRSMFSDCTSLKIAPELPATTLADYCYQYMFEGCSSLNYIKCLATNISTSKCTDDWVNGVAASGTFIKNANMSWATGISGIPSGWKIENATS